MASYTTLQVAGWLGLLFLVFASPLATICVVSTIAIIAFTDCDVSTKILEYFGESPDVLDNQVVWITGASSGIGEALAYELARRRCSLVLSARAKSELERVAENCHAIHMKQCLVLPMDVTDTEGHQGALRKVLDKFGKVDVLVNNAGRSIRGMFLHTDPEVERHLFDLDFFAQVSLARHVTSHMVETGVQGQVMIMSSVAKLGLPCQASYCAAKAALHGYFESVRVETRPNQINVCLAVLGPVHSKISERAFTEKLGQVAGKGMGIDKRMLPARAGFLLAVALANRLPEVWISLVFQDYSLCPDVSAFAL